METGMKWDLVAIGLGLVVIYLVGHFACGLFS